MKKAALGRARNVSPPTKGAQGGTQSTISKADEDQIESPRKDTPEHNEDSNKSVTELISEQLSDLSTQGKILLNLTFQYLFFVLDDTPNLPNPIIQEFRGLQGEYKEYLKTRKGQLLLALVSTPSFCSLFADENNTLIDKKVEKNAKQLADEALAKRKLSLRHEQAQTNIFLDNDYQPCIPEDLSQTIPFYVRISDFFTVNNLKGVYEETKTGIHSPFRSNDTVLNNFVKISALLVEIGKTILTCNEVRHLAQKNDDVFTYTDSKEQIHSLLETFNNLCDSLATCRKSLSTVLANRVRDFKDKALSEIPEDEPWKKNMSKIFRSEPHSYQKYGDDESKCCAAGSELHEYKQAPDKPTICIGIPDKNKKILASIDECKRITAAINEKLSQCETKTPRNKLKEDDRQKFVKASTQLNAHIAHFLRARPPAPKHPPAHVETTDKTQVSSSSRTNEGDSPRNRDDSEREQASQEKKTMFGRLRSISEKRLSNKPLTGNKESDQQTGSTDSAVSSPTVSRTGSQKSATTAEKQEQFAGGRSISAKNMSQIIAREVAVQQTGNTQRSTVVLGRARTGSMLSQKTGTGHVSPTASSPRDADADPDDTTNVDQRSIKTKDMKQLWASRESAGGSKDSPFLSRKSGTISPRSAVKKQAEEGEKPQTSPKGSSTAPLSPKLPKKEIELSGSGALPILTNKSLSTGEKRAKSPERPQEELVRVPHSSAYISKTGQPSTDDRQSLSLGSPVGSPVDQRERLAAEQREKEEAERKAREAEVAKQQRLAADQRQREETEHKAREEEAKKRQQAEQKEKEETERRAQEEEAAKKQQQAEQKEREKNERKARLEEAKKRLDADKREREETERKAREEEAKKRQQAEQKEKEETERKAREEAAKKERLAAEQKEKEKEEVERKAREEAAKKERLAAEQKEKEEAERSAKDSAEGVDQKSIKKKEMLSFWNQQTGSDSGTLSRRNSTTVASTSPKTSPRGNPKPPETQKSVVVTTENEKTSSLPAPEALSETPKTTKHPDQGTTQKSTDKQQTPAGSQTSSTPVQSAETQKSDSPTKKDDPSKPEPSKTNAPSSSTASSLPENTLGDIPVLTGRPRTGTGLGKSGSIVKPAVPKPIPPGMQPNPAVLSRVSAAKTTPPTSPQPSPRSIHSSTPGSQPSQIQTTEHSSATLSKDPAPTPPSPGKKEEEPTQDNKGKTSALQVVAAPKPCVDTTHGVSTLQQEVLREKFLGVGPRGISTIANKTTFTAIGPKPSAQRGKQNQPKQTLEEIIEEAETMLTAERNKSSGGAESTLPAKPVPTQVEFFQKFKGHSNGAAKIYTNKDIDEIRQALESNAEIKTVLLQNNDIGPCGGTQLSCELLKHTNLTTLFMSNNPTLFHEISDEEKDIKKDLAGHACVKAFADLLEKHPSLQHLVIDECGLGTYGAIFLARGLKQNTTLTSLDIRYNDITDDGISYICDALTYHPTIETLLVSANRLKETGGEALLRLLKENNHIINLAFFEDADSFNPTRDDKIENYFSKELTSALTAAIEANRVLAQRSINNK